MKIEYCQKCDRGIKSGEEKAYIKDGQTLCEQCYLRATEQEHQRAASEKVHGKSQDELEAKKLKTTVLIVLVATILAVVLLAVGLNVGYLLGKQSIRDGTHELKLNLRPSIDAMSVRIDAAKWSEGKAMMGTIATAIRAYCAEIDEDVPDLTVLDFDWDLGFRPGDLQGTYFTRKNFSIVEGSYDVTNNQLTFTIKATKGTGINSPNSYALDQDGSWLADEM